MVSCGVEQKLPLIPQSTQPKPVHPPNSHVFWNITQYGEQDVMLGAAEQLVERSQTHAIADALKWLQAGLLRQDSTAGVGRKTLAQWLAELEAAIDQHGLDVLAPHLLPGNLARPRVYEIAAAVNRIRTLQVTQAPQREPPRPASREH